MVADELHSSGLSNAAGELLQLVAGLVLFRLASGPEAEGIRRRTIFASAGISDSMEEVEALARSWTYLPRMVGVEAPLKVPVPRIVDEGGLSSTRAAGFLWDGIKSTDAQTTQGRSELLLTLNAAIALWAREAKYGGEFTTAGDLADLMVALADPQPGERIYDPCFGTGSLLARAASAVFGATADRRVDGSRPKPSIWGQELEPTLYVVALARIILSGEPHPELRIADSLADPIPASAPYNEFDCILANVPFGFRPPKDVVASYPIPTASSESAFIQHILARLRTGGRAVIVVPESFLFRRGADVELRRKLVREYSVETIWSIPKGVFRSSAGLKASIVVIRRDPPVPSVVFIGERVTTPILSNREERDHILLSEPPGSGKRHLLATLTGSRYLVGPLAAAVGLKSIASLIGPTGLAVLTGLVAMQNWPGRGQESFVAQWQRWRNALAHGREIPDLPQGASSGSSVEEDVRTVPVHELAKRHWELVPTSASADELDSFLDLIRNQLGPLEIVALEEVAEVLSGVSYTSEDIVRDPEVHGSPLPKDEDPQLPNSSAQQIVPLVRVQDVSSRKDEQRRYAKVRRPSMFLRPHAARKVAEQLRLKAGDILLTRSGTVGHTAVVDQVLAGAVPANGLIVIRPRPVFDAIAMFRLLQTAPYLDWFRARATGSVIQHLSTRAVRALQIPALTLEQQRFLAEAVRSTDDASAVLAVFRRMSGESQWTTFLLNDAGVDALLKAGDGSGYSADWWRALDQTIGRCRSMEAEEGEDEELARYLRIWAEHAVALADAVELPPGLERYAALQSWDKWALHELWPAKDRAQEAFPSPGIRSKAAARFHAMCEVLMDAASTEAARIADSASLRVSLKSTSFVVDVPSELQVSLVNGGVGPLRRVSILVQELETQKELALVRPEQEASLTFAFTPTLTGKQQFRILWSGERINGKRATGSEQVSIEVTQISEIRTPDPFRVNPYVTGAPVDTDRTFFGRAEIIDQIHRLLRPDGPSTVILLEGNRRAGKTSILHRLQQSDTLRNWIPVYCQFQGIGGEPNAQSLYRLVARELLYAVATPHTPELVEPLRAIANADPLRRKTLCRELVATIGSERPFEQFESLLELALSSIGSRRILLMLDEFEKIHQGIEQHQMSPLVPENFRYIFHTYNRVSGILSGSIRIKKLRKEYWNVLFGIGTPIPVGPLSPAAARQLVIEPASGVLSYSDSAIERLLELCAHQPFLVQSLASNIFEVCASSNLTSVTTELVNKSADSMVANNEHFQTIYRQQALTARQRFLASLIDQLTDAPARVTFDLIRDQMEASGVPVGSDGKLKEDLEELQEQEIIRFVAESNIGHYRIEVPLFSRWLRTKIDFQAATREAIEE